MDDKYARFWLGVKRLGEELAKEEMWGMFTQLVEDLGPECPKLGEVGKYLSAKPEIKEVLKEMNENGTG